MQQNILLEIEYIGIGYFGFQIQEKKVKNQITVQAIIEQALKQLFKQKIRVVPAGRTDRGVHAVAQVVNFKVSTKILPEKIKRALNSFLPKDVRIKKVKRVPSRFHSRFSAKSKVYRYKIYNKKEPSVFFIDFAWQIRESLDFAAMRKAAAGLIGCKDFSSFAKKAKKYKTCIRELKNISIKKSGEFIYIDIEANGFLRTMARNIVSFLVKAGSETVFEANKPAPAQGLYLYRVKYK
jgi:tRNA pseudouridine38-40 synthase